MTTTIQPITIARRGSGFSLMEVLLSMAIFAIGFAAIAAVFPVASLLQSQASVDSMSQQAEHTIEALLRVRPYEFADLVDTNEKFPSGTDLAAPMAVGGEDLTFKLEDRKLWTHWKMENRGFPSTNFFDQRSIYWVPLIRRNAVPATDRSHFETYVFILSREGFPDRVDLQANGYTKDSSDWANYQDPVEVPGVFRVSVAMDPANESRFVFDNRKWPSYTQAGEADQVRTGDQVIDNNGKVYTVLSADGSGAIVNREISQNPNAVHSIWYGVPPGPNRRSPTVRIVGPY